MDGELKNLMIMKNKKIELILFFTIYKHNNYNNNNNNNNVTLLLQIIRLDSFRET